LGNKNLCAEHAEYIAQVLNPECLEVGKDKDGKKLKVYMSKKRFLERIKENLEATSDRPS
jgi:hypothetical protein